MVTKPQMGLVRKRRWKETASRAACTASVHVGLTEKNSPCSDDTLQSIDIDPEKVDKTGRVQRARDEYKDCSSVHSDMMTFHSLSPCYVKVFNVRVTIITVLDPSREAQAPCHDRYMRSGRADRMNDLNGTRLILLVSARQLKTSA